MKSNFAKIFFLIAAMMAIFSGIRSAMNSGGNDTSFSEPLVHTYGPYAVDEHLVLAEEEIKRDASGDFTEFSLVVYVTSSDVNTPDGREAFFETVPVVCTTENGGEQCKPQGFAFVHELAFHDKESAPTRKSKEYALRYITGDGVKSSRVDSLRITLESLAPHMLNDMKMTNKDIPKYILPSIRWIVW